MAELKSRADTLWLAKLKIFTMWTLTIKSALNPLNQSVLKHRRLLSHDSGVYKAEIQCQQDWFLLKPLSLACRRPSSFQVFPASSLCVCVSVFISSSYEDTSQTEVK